MVKPRLFVVIVFALFLMAQSALAQETVSNPAPFCDDPNVGEEFMKDSNLEPMDYELDVDVARMGSSCQFGVYYLTLSQGTSAGRSEQNFIMLSWQIAPRWFATSEPIAYTSDHLPVPVALMENGKAVFYLALTDLVTRFKRVTLNHNGATEIIDIALLPPAVTNKFYEKSLCGWPGELEMLERFSWSWAMEKDSKYGIRFGDNPLWIDLGERQGVPCGLGLATVWVDSPSESYAVNYLILKDGTIGDPLRDHFYWSPLGAKFDDNGNVEYREYSVNTGEIFIILLLNNGMTSEMTHTVPSALLRAAGDLDRQEPDAPISYVRIVDDLSITYLMDDLKSLGASDPGFAISPWKCMSQECEVQMLTIQVGNLPGGEKFRWDVYAIQQADGTWKRSTFTQGVSGAHKPINSVEQSGTILTVGSYFNNFEDHSLQHYRVLIDTVSGVVAGAPSNPQVACN
jgi:hypothetical protein